MAEVIFESKKEARERKRKNKKKREDLISLAVSARSNDMTYGQYVAQSFAKQVVIKRAW